MSQASEAKGQIGSSSGHPVRRSQEPIKRSIVISVAKDSNARQVTTPPMSLGLGSRHIETALGTIAPKAVMTLPPVPSVSEVGACMEFSNLKGHAITSSVPSRLMVDEVVSVGLPSVPGGSDDLTIRRKKPAVIQQLIANQISLKPGLNINDSSESPKFSALDYYGCREEPLDDLLLVTFHLIVKMPVQAAADLVVDMPDWMRKKFLTRFKLPPLINEVLSSRIDGYEQAEDDAVAVMAEIVWSNALAAGSMAEAAATFFPRDIGQRSSLNRLRIDGASRKLRPRKDISHPVSLDIALPVMAHHDDGEQEPDRSSDIDLTFQSTLIAENDQISKELASEDDFLTIARSVWGSDCTENSSATMVEPSPVSFTMSEEKNSCLGLDESVARIVTLSVPLAEESLSVTSDSTALTLPPPPVQISSKPSDPSANQGLGDVGTAKSHKTDVSVVKLDNGNLVLL